jgi:hypothetical protein
MCNDGVHVLPPVSMPFRDAGAANDAVDTVVVEDDSVDDVVDDLIDRERVDISAVVNEVQMFD